MRLRMKLNQLEKAVVGRFLRASKELLTRHPVDLDRVVVASRDFTGAGFLTKCQQDEHVKFFEDDVSLRWTGAGAYLGASKLDTGYLVYVDDGYLSNVEGYTFGEAWPSVVDEFSLYASD